MNTCRSGIEIQWTYPQSALFFALQFSLIPVGLQLLDFLLFLASGFLTFCHCLAPLPSWLKLNTLCFQYVYWNTQSNYEFSKLYWGLGVVVGDEGSLVHRTFHLFSSFCSPSFPFPPQLWGEFTHSFPSCPKDLQIPFPLLDRTIFLFLWGLHSPHWTLLPQPLFSAKVVFSLKGIIVPFVEIISLPTSL